MVVITAGKDPCYFLKEFFKIKDLRVLIKFKLCAGALRGSHILTIRLKLRRSSSCLAYYIQAQVTPTSTPTGILSDSQVFQTKNSKVSKEKLAKKLNKWWKRVAKSGRKLKS